jgi:hypothetical protein
MLMMVIQHRDTALKPAMGFEGQEPNAENERRAIAAALHLASDQQGLRQALILRPEYPACGVNRLDNLCDILCSSFAPFVKEIAQIFCEQARKAFFGQYPFYIYAIEQGNRRPNGHGVPRRAGRERSLSHRHADGANIIIANRIANNPIRNKAFNMVLINTLPLGQRQKSLIEFWRQTKIAVAGDGQENRLVCADAV